MLIIQEIIGGAFMNDQNTISPNGNEEPLYLFISVKRLFIMSILSLGVYEAYWIYKNWSYVKKREGLDISPFWRGFFGIFYCHSLLNKIYEDVELNKVEQPNFSPSVLATWWVVLTIAGNIANRITDRISNTAIEYSILVISLFTFLLFIPVQQYINTVHERLGYSKKYKLWSVGHVICIVLGIIIWGILALGLFL